MLAEWFPGVVRTLQLAVSALLAGDVEDVHRELDQAIRALPAPHAPEECMAMRCLLVEFTWHGARELHARVHRRRRPACSYRGDATVLETFQQPGDPREVLRAWLSTFVADLARAHPKSKASRVAHVLCEKYRRAQTVTHLARHEHMPAWRLRRTFAREFGVSIPAYREHARVLASFTPLTDVGQKLEVIAADVGYRSKKNFYRAFTKTTGLTPTAFRRSTPEVRLSVTDRVQAVLFGMVPRHPIPPHSTR